MVKKIAWSFQAIFGDLLGITLTCENISDYFRMGALYFLNLIAPFVLIIVVVALLINFFQHGFLFTTKPLMPKLSKLSPLKNIKNIVGIKGFVELIKGIFKVSVIGIVAYLTIKSEIPNFTPLMDKGIVAISSGILSTALNLGFKLALIILILGILDWQFQKWKHNKDLKMTRQEVKDEHKMTEGDPKIKARIRRTQFNMSFNRMIKKMPEANVVVTNPVHIAVALKYDSETMQAPLVIAKGRRKLAERIKSIAREHDIPIVEDPPLARSLFQLVEIGWEIPYDLFQAVAEVLALVYRLKEKV